MRIILGAPELEIIRSFSLKTNSSAGNSGISSRKEYVIGRGAKFILLPKPNQTYSPNINVD